MDVGLLDDRGQRLLGHPARLQKAGEVAALAQLRDAQLDRSGAGLPVALAVAVALGEPLGRSARRGRSGQGFDLQLHQPLRGEADHLAQEVSVGGLLQQLSQVHRVVGHRRVLGSRWSSQPNLPKIRNDHRKPLARYSAMESALRERLATAAATPQWGHDLNAARSRSLSA